MSEFNEIASAITNSPDWYAAIQQSRTLLHRENPSGVDCTTIGHHAWRQLTPIQQAKALPDLFTAYLVQLHEEERAAKLQATASVKTYLEGDDEYILQDALQGVRPIGEDTVIDGVCASALANVLDELDLLRHRLAMRDRKEGGQ
ncbi:hypothetical protein [Streptomyces acidiscabies]|uniref:Uncharacterized protein n=1 Tax=Streptomyces acidiscabies TaxID=42234 RepID=A0AAP6BM27_9ACTN|nr:hypothetical protein [Streptomyces acidiscabies]MBZ3918173.1 hypothetical protein [Streptomyces acidiscabies]MDX2967272.1 hypothetical protein [Streptomyces acidiscabies]MDX3016760.1 hypothetical protein [Streptomyces acidiscabies]MDX3794063.1 hypothetical protein [Streptomyces acidiscabies]